ncbi:hypothetical protein ACJJTC_004283 [Scirpophaga incertulas]
MTKLLLFFATIVGGAVLVHWLFQCADTPMPTLDQNEWWGPAELKTRQDKTIRPFKVKFEEDMIKDLRSRLQNHRQFTPPLEGVGFEYGFNSNQLGNWIKYWAEQYDFAQRENFLNKYPHFKTYIQGLDIHFIRVKPQVPAGVKILPLLLSTRLARLVIPSLPGYGFSDAAVRPGLGVPQTAVIFKNLMERLGHKKFYVQGGDWGAGVASAVATLYPDNVLGMHINLAFVKSSTNMLMMTLGSYFPSLVVEPHLADRMYPLADFFAFVLEESGYYHLQSTKPDTIGIALNDSPSGLLAYIIEKFSTWTNRNNKFKADGGLATRFTKDRLIDNLMLYWSTNKITTSMRYYAENASNKVRELNLDSLQTKVPAWAFQAKYELFYQPPSFLRRKYPNLLNVTVSEDGGHFLALELPQVFVDDVFKAVKAFNEFHLTSKKTEL